MKKPIVIPGVSFDMLHSALPSSRYLCVLWAIVGWCGVTSSLAQSAPAAVVKVVPSGQNISTSPHQPILALPANGSASATLTATGLGFTPTNYLWTQTAPSAVKDQHIHAAQATVTFSATTGAQVTASFPSRGIYQLVLTAKNSTTTVSTQVWVHVWDRLTGLNPLQKVGRNPGLLPPSSVRQLSPDPGPYQHPRLLFTDADWPELNAKSNASAEVSGAIARLQTALNNNFDKTSAPVGSLRTYANALTAWADGGFSDSTYSTSVETVRVFSERKQVGALPSNHLPDALLVASYVVWVRNNPSLAQTAIPAADQSRFQYLAKVAAAAARAELTRVRLGISTTTTAAPDMAVVYDLLYDWMTPSQRTDLRDYLYTIGYGFFNTGTGGLSRSGTPPTYRANGDFPNLVDPWILAALVIEGEEASVTPSVVAANTPTAAAATGPAAWPNASPASVWNLNRMMRWYSEFYVTPWGSPLHHHAYFEASSGMSGPAMLAFARRGQNGFVTTHLYQASFHAFNNLNPESPTTPPVLWDHHDGMGYGNGIGGYAGRYLARYMYPDDALMDYMYPNYRREVNIDFYTALFHIDRPAKTMAQVATEKGLSRTHFDPFRGAGTTRNTWGENDLSLYFECRPDIQGHMHAEANNFSLYALGRPWSTPPGYHVTINDAAATVLIQDPTLASDPATEGYIGQSPSAATITTSRNQFPTPSGKVLETTEDPSGQWTVFAGDASAAYQFAFEGGIASTLDSGKRKQDFYYGEVLSHMYPDYNPSADTSTLKVGNLSYNPVAYAYRSIFSARGARPYVLVIDDIAADGSTPRNYRWNMPAFGRTAVNTLRMQAGATATDAVLFHQPDATSGPRLLVRDLSEQSSTGQSAIFLDTRLNGDGKPQLDIGFDNNSGRYTTVQSNRLLITRQNVVSPKFKVLLFPHQSTEDLPLTSWNAEKTIASIDLRNGFTDRITLDASHADKRTRIVTYTRTVNGRSAPTLTLPANMTLQASAAATAFTGQPGASATFSIGAKSDSGATLIPTVSSPSGTVFPVGENVVHVTAVDSLGQVSSQRFTITVIPAAPVVKVVSATNLGGHPQGIGLQWQPVARATAYSVKRAPAAGGVFTVVSNRQSAEDLDFDESGLPAGSYRYIVSSWLDGLEGAPSAEIPLVAPTGPFNAGIIGSQLPGNGAYRDGDSYLLTFTGGRIGGSSEQMSCLTMPWSGDGVFTTRIVSVNGIGGAVSQFGGYGIFMRQNTSANGPMAASCFNTFVSPFFLSVRATAGATATSTGPFTQTGAHPAPVWLRLIRSGNQCTALYSKNGSDWTQTAPSATVEFSGSTLVGLGGGGQNGTLTSTRFDNVVFLKTPISSQQGASVTLNWTGSVAKRYAVSRATSAAGPFTVLADDLTGTTYTDESAAGGQNHYRITGYGESGSSSDSPVLQVTVARIDITVPSSITVPATGSDGAKVAFTVQAIDTIDGPLVPVVSPPSGSTFPPGTRLVSVTATNSQGITRSVSFPVTVLPYSPPPATGNWTLSQIGNQPATPGTMSQDPATGAITISGRGGTGGVSGDIWSGFSEGFTYAALPWTGDGAFTARIVSFSSSDGSAKAGIMFRDQLAVGSKNSTAYMLRTGASFFQNKIAYKGSVSYSTTSGRGVPEWIRLIRKGQVFTAFFSNDGVNWSQQGGPVTHTMVGTSPMVGLAVAPRTGGTTGTARFENISFVAPPASPDGLAALASPQSVALSWTASPNAETYTIRRASSASGPFTTIATGLHSISYVDASIAPSAAAWYQVTATNLAGESTASRAIMAPAIMQIGSQPLIPGTVSHCDSTSSYTVQAAGGLAGTGASGDIWSGTSEGFTFVPLPWMGDGIFTARLASFTASDPAAKAGIMFRESSVAGSKNSIVYLSANGDLTFQNKTTTNGGVSLSSASGRGIPEWIRLVRSGGTFTAFYSENGTTWTQQGTAVTHTMTGTTMMVGLAVAPRTGGATATAKFENVTFVGSTESLTANSPTNTDDPSALQTWRQSNFDTDTHTGSAANDADLDGDGSPNLLEYALGTTPTSAASSPTVDSKISDQKLQITFLRARADVTYHVEASTSLATDSWEIIATNPGAVGQSVTVADSVNIADANPAHRFLRLRVTAP